MTGETITRWRYWVLKPGKTRLRPFGPKDTTVWTDGETVARCRHDRSHVPPHPDCTCGLYATTLADVTHALACRDRLADQVGWAAYEQESGWASVTVHGRTVRPEDVQSRPRPVIGQVEMHDAVEVPNELPSGDGPYPSRRWRARSANIAALYVPTDLADVAEAISNRYGAPCHVGNPDLYSHQE